MRYWFDDDAGSVKTTNMMDGLHSIDVSSVMEGLHTIHYQIIDSENNVCAPYSEIFLAFSKGAQSNAFTLRYWFDDDTKVMTCNANAGIQALDASKLLDGLHTLHYQVIDKEGKLSYIASNIFMKMGGNESTDNVTASKLIYWFDDQESTNTVSMSNGMQVLDASELLDGLHTIHYQVVCSDGTITSAYSSIFLRMSVDSESSAAKSIRYWFDDEQEATNIAIGSGIQTLDASHLLDGLHTVHYQLIDDKGFSATPMSSIFLKTTVGVATTAQKLRYWFDDNSDVKTTDVAGGTQSIDVSGLLTGLHTLHYQLVDDQGNVCAPVSGLFLKQYDKVVESGENVITQYVYWMNDNSADTKTVKIDNPSSPYQLITLLPMIKAPIRSTSFYFEAKDGEPTIYAKNDLHIRFEDAACYWVDDVRSFIDYSVFEVVTDIDGLKNTQTFNRPSENGIKWFKFEAEYGDSIALKSNQATSIQIFSTSGKELYATSGSNSVNFGGCHVFEDGTFYVAVHDVTGSAQNITLESKKIEKFCIFDYTPDKITSEGNVIMTFSGNGLEYVKSVKLTGGDISIVADTLMAKSSEMMAAFHLNESIASIKKLSLEVYFNNEIKNESKTLTLKDAITLEPVKAGNIEVSIMRENRVGDPYPIQIHIKNTGNLAYTAIPFGLAFDNVNNFDGCTFENFKLLLSEERYKERDFFTYTDNLLGQGKKGLYIPMILPYLGPYEELIYTVGIKTKIPHANINAYAWTIEPWSESVKQYMLESGRANAPRRAKECTPSNLPQVYDRLDDLSDIADALDAPTSPIDLAKVGVGIGEAIGGIGQGATRMNEDAVFDAYGIDPSFLPGDLDDYRMQFRYCPRSPIDIINEFLPDWIQLHPRAARASNSNSNSIASMASGDCPRVKPEPINPWIPGDPNEMTGYLSESGSHYINEDVVNVGYDIEFENDPEIANAAAHHIVIRDTLDARLFDFDSFEPKTVKVSGKEVELDGSYPFVKSLDMRPEIYSIAELRGDFDKKTGIATWDLIALDPMTMEPTDDIMQGILPVNTQDGNGIGNVTYTINLRQNLGDGTVIPNSASIIFDYNEPIETPVWTNIIDAVPPVSEVASLELVNDSIVRVHCSGEDERSGVWKYSVFVQYGEGTSWNEVAQMDSAYFDFRFYEDVDYGFCVLATDSAGNVEEKFIEREYSLLNGKITKNEYTEISSAPVAYTTCKVYDLNGRLIQNDKQRGIVIKNRKKILRK